MSRMPAIFGMFAALTFSALAQEPAVFTPPQAYPVDRYEAVWSKNPFTLKTAPAAVESISFAKDLAIVSHYGEKANPTIVIVNTKTHERTRLKQGETASNGMKLLSFKLGETRKETTVEVVLGSETTELKYNPEYMGQMAASGGAAAKSVPGAPTTPGQRPGAVPIPGMNPGMQQRPMPTGVPPRIQLPNSTVPTARPTGSQPQQGGGVVMGGGGNNVNLSLNPSQNGALVSGVNPDAPPPPIRRRLVSSPEQVLPQ